VSDEGEMMTPDVWRDLKEVADRARAEGWTPEQTRAAIAAVVALTPEVDETDKPAA
jgi:hypothetical protein